MDWIGAKVDWTKKNRFFAHPYIKCRIRDSKDPNICKRICQINLTKYWNIITYM